MPMRRTDVKLTRLRIGHTRFTHRHLLFGERAPECPSCHVSYTVHHILIDCPVFNHHRITFFHTSILTLSDLPPWLLRHKTPFTHTHCSALSYQQRVFAYHRSQYSRYSAIYTDGSKRADYVGCGVVIEDIMHGYSSTLLACIFTAEANCHHLPCTSTIDSHMPRKYCIYTDSMSVLESLENYHDRCHPAKYVQYSIFSTVQQGFRYRVLLAAKSRRNHRQRASGQRGKVGDDPSTARSSAIG
ncbi:putative RNA-directed DNA polymerase from transposon X-element [Trichonephila clavipes]|nr:putative RNA-directed DNA polymerase from transposon X-element [Trichonephila clavipes]